MDEVKGKMKDFMKKINNPFAGSGSNSSKFKGQGRVLGGGSSSSSNPATTIPNNLQRYWQSEPPSSDDRPAKPKEPLVKPNEPLEKKLSESLSLEGKGSEVAGSNPKSDGFDPFGAYISSRTGPKAGTSMDMFQCPVCNAWFKSEQEVSAHVENCLDKNAQNGENEKTQEKSELGDRVGAFLSGKPSDKTLEVVLKLLRNIVSDPDNEKFRRIRMNNPKILETVGEAVGGVQLLECVGFRFQKEGEDMWGVMEMPSADGISVVRQAIAFLESQVLSTAVPSSGSASNKTDPVGPRKIDRQVRVFFAAPESMASKIELPDSFYELSAAELKREAESRKKKLEESQLLIPKSFREKQAKATRKRYKATVIRIQFPDGVILQGVFLPSEPASALYEFARSALKEECLDFELLGPAVPKSRVIPCSAKTGERIPTLEDEDLVPAALIKCKPIETDSIVFTGLCNDLLAVSEPLTPAAFPSDVQFKLVFQAS